MSKPTALSLPESCTSGQLAGLLRVSERVVSARKADGRLPASPVGGVDLRAVVKAGVDALAAEQRRRAGAVGR